MATLHKMNRLLVSHGIDPTRATILRVEQSDPLFQIVYVEFDGIQYIIDNVSKIRIDNTDNTTNNNNDSKWEVTKNNVKKPRGWHFRDVYVDNEGNVYHKGVEKPELKGTLSPTE